MLELTGVHGIVDPQVAACSPDRWHGNLQPPSARRRPRSRGSAMMHNGCMTSTLIQVRGVDPRTRDELKVRAARRGQSLTAYVRDLLEREAAKPDIADVFARVDRRAESAAVSSVDIIRADRDGR